jgi:protocatechuate 3,4-dioxygenase beta subunit
MSSSRAAELTAATAALGLWSALLVGPVADALSPSRAPAAPAVTGAEVMPRPQPVAKRTLQPQTASAGVAGRVIDAAGRPVAGAIIFLRDLATAETPIGWLRAITDAAGYFRVDGLLPGFYSLVALDEGSHGTATQRLPLLGDATARLQLILSEPISI